MVNSARQIPLGVEPSSSTPPAPPHQSAQDTLSLMTTLRTFIVEDNPVILKNLVDTLEELTDLKVIGTTGNEEDAVRALSTQADTLDLVIVDVFLNSGSGLGVLKSAQQMDLAARRVVLTNYATEDIRRRCANLGADAVFDKSKELEDLIDYCEKMTSA